MSSPSTLRKPRPFSQPVTNLLSIRIPLQSIMTPPPPRSPPTPTTTRLTTVSNISFTRQYFFRFRFPTIFTQLLPFFQTRNSHLFSSWRNYCRQIKSIPTNPLPTNHFQQTHFQQSARFIFFPLPRYRVSLLFQVEFPTFFRTNVITQIISGLPPCSDFILFIGY